MRKNVTLLIVLCVIFVGVLFDQHVTADPSSGGRGKGVSQKLFTLQDGWSTIDTIASGTTTPTSTNRTAALFVSSDAKNSTFEVKSGWNNITLRLSSTTEGDTSVTDIFAMRGTADHFTRIATLTWTTGTQTSSTSGEEFADTVVETNRFWHTTPSPVSPTGNYIAEWSVDFKGGGTIGISPTTITNAATIQITGE